MCQAVAKIKNVRQAILFFAQTWILLGYRIGNVVLVVNFSYKWK